MKLKLLWKIKSIKNASQNVTVILKSKIECPGNFLGNEYQSMHLPRLSRWLRLELFYMKYPCNCIFFQQDALAKYSKNTCFTKEASLDACHTYRPLLRQVAPSSHEGSYAKQFLTYGCHLPCQVTPPMMTTCHLTRNGNWPKDIQWPVVFKESWHEGFTQQGK